MANKKDAGDNNQSLSNIIKEYNLARLGLDMDSSDAQIIKGKLSYALNAVVENFDANSIDYQNEPGNIMCLNFPEGYLLIGRYFINEQNKHIFFLTNPITGNSQIGYMVNNDCQYRIIVSDLCLGFSVNFPIHKVVHKISNCTTEIYWADNIARRYLDIDNVPYKLVSGSILCNPIYSTELDCNQLKVQPNFLVPSLTVSDVVTGGDITAGTYQFAIQYSDAASNPLTGYYSVTNPCPIFDPFTISVNFNTPVGKSIVVDIDNLDGTGQFEYFNLAVIKTINNIPSVDLVGTYSITGSTRQITYTGQNKELTALSIADIFEKFPYYDIAEDLTTARDVLIWKGLTTVDRINYQSIATKITLLWESWKLPAKEGYKEETNATNFRSYLRDEIYAFEIVFLLSNGRQTDGFHIPGREKFSSENVIPDVPDTNEDFIGAPDYFSGNIGYSPYWKIYNTATVIATDPNYDNSQEYKGPYQYGNFSFWESEEEYPCNVDLWGDLAGKKIRHHKFPDVLVSPINQSSVFTNANNMVMEDTAIFPLGVKINLAQVIQLIKESDLTSAQKDEITGFKIIRGNRGTNKSVIAKGILRNVGKYDREGQEYYFPNYPYNDINPDPFLNKTNNAWTQQCNSYNINITTLSNGQAIIDTIDCNTNKSNTVVLTELGPHTICSIGFPKIQGPAEGTVNSSTYDVYRVSSFSSFPQSCAGWRVQYIGSDGEIKSMWIRGYPYNDLFIINVFQGTVPKDISEHESCGKSTVYIETVTTDSEGNIIVIERNDPTEPFEAVSPCNSENPLPAISTQDSYRQIFNSPETSFGQPFLGTILKLESVIFGAGKAHFVEVKNNAKYKLLTLEAQQDALDSSERIGELTSPFSPSAMFAAYQSYIEIYVNGITRKNYAYSFNSIASYNYNLPVLNGLGIKQRNLEIARYLIPGVQSIGEEFPVNNYNRESSVFLKTQESLDNGLVTIPKTDLPFPKDSTSMLLTGVEDNSRYTLGDAGLCGSPAKEKDISVVSYYASIKNQVNNQWGQIYSYSTVDTGFQITLQDVKQSYTIFGGDTFINRFSFKTKLPFFIDNRVGAPDDSDIFYDEIGNVAYPRFWHSARSILSDVTIKGTGTLSNFFSYKAHNFDCPNDQSLSPNPDNPTENLPSDSNPNRTFYDGSFYLFAYGMPNFYCESSYNVELRQAFNSREGDFWPHVSSSIPDDWVQEDYVSILNDNTYYYNITFSKQNKENDFSNLPPDWSEKLCYTYFPFRAIYSDIQSDDQDNRVNNWLIYRAVSYFDFPQNYGKFISIDGIENSAVLARFENKTYLYNNLLTIDTSNPQAAYIGNSNLFRGAPPIDFADTDLGFIGTQNKMLLKIPQGQITVDAKRGHIFLLQGTRAEVISKSGSGLNSFLKEHLPYKLLKYYPEIKSNVNGEIITIPGVNVDNNFNGIGLHGVYDNRFERVIITKLDYIPLSDKIKFDPYKQEFYVDFLQNDNIRTKVELTDPTYFCNKSFTLSYNLNTASWISFHSYIPNYYVAENNFFYSGNQVCCSDFDYIAGELVPTPSTTTTTTVFVPICLPFTGTAYAILEECIPLYGQIIITECDLEGDAEVTVPPVCVRPDSGIYNGFIIGYSEEPNPYVDSTMDPYVTCDTISYLNSLEDYTGITVVYMDVYYLSLEIGSFIYEDNGTQDCSTIPDGYYFTQESQASNIFYHVVDGQITEILTCPLPTTTTTTTSTTTVFPVVSCEELVSSGGEGISEYLINLDSVGGLIAISFKAYAVPDKLELIHNGVKVATTGMTVSNSGPFDNTYGDPTIPTYGQSLATDQFIGNDKGSIPSRQATFTSDTGSSLTLTPGYQQLVWWEYTPADYSINSELIVRVVGSSGIFNTIWDFKRMCPPCDLEGDATVTEEPTTTTTTTV